MASDFPLTKEEFEEIYSKVPRLTVEILLVSDKGIYLTKRTIEPCKGQWHLPGGTVYFGESLVDSVRRVASRELGIKVDDATNIGLIEYPSHYLNGLDAPVGVVYRVEKYTGSIKINDEANDKGWFKTAPSPLHADQSDFLVDSRFIST